MKKLIVEDVSSIYVNKKNKHLALSHISFSISANDFLTIVGPTGCGKTTLLKCVAGFQEFSGKILIDGVDIEQIPVSKRNIAYITQTPALYPKMTIFDNIAFSLKINNTPYDEINRRVNDVCKELDILHLLSRKPKHLSLGQQQRVCIAKAIIKRADLYLFDEPFSALDEKAKNELALLLKVLSVKMDTPFVYVTHNLQEAVRLGSKMMVMNDSKIVQIDEPLNIINNPINDFVKEFICF